MKAAKKGSILFLSMEVAPLAVVGGLSQVLRFLPKQLRAAGYDVRLAMPNYQPLFGKISQRPILQKLPAILSGTLHELSVSATLIDDKVPIYLISGIPNFANIADTKNDLYSKPQIMDYALFGQAVLEMLQEFATAGIWKADFIHAHDYQTAFATIYLKSALGNKLRGFASPPKTIFTIHNLGFPGKFSAGLLPELGLPQQLNSSHWLEFYAELSTLKGGLVLSDLISTVSPTYAMEILGEPYGERLQGVLQERHRQGRLRGILNGIDREGLASEASETDPPFDFRTGLNDFLKTKTLLKNKLRQKLHLEKRRDMPLLVIMGRWGWQKGWPLFAELLMNGYLSDFQVLIETWASAGQDEMLMQRMRDFQSRNAKKIALIENQPPDRLRLAAPDFVLLPSIYEPCGLVQMEAMCFATIPIVRKTGGLADTVFDGENGFVFDSELGVFDVEQKTPRFYAAVKALEQSLRRALAAYQHPQRFRQLQQNAFAMDNSWQRRIPAYAQLYEDAASLAPVIFTK